jgi:hypothetical protein
METRQSLAGTLGSGKPFGTGTTWPEATAEANADSFLRCFLAWRLQVFRKGILFLPYLFFTVLMHNEQPGK